MGIYSLSIVMVTYISRYVDSAQSKHSSVISPSIKIETGSVESSSVLFVSVVRESNSSSKEEGKY